jgi:hypothetical protein
MRRQYPLLAGLVATLVLTASSLARATPHPLPFTYLYETLGEGDIEVEQYVDYVPVKLVPQDSSTGKPIWYGATQFQTEFEYGITNRLELGIYVSYVPQPAGASVDLTEGTGIKQRLRYRIADEGELPIDLGIYGELTESHDEFEIEAKLLLQKRLGPVKLLANLWGEREFEYAGAKEWVLSPTGGITVQVTPTFHPGLEWWMHAEYRDGQPSSARVFDQGPHQYVGPAFLFNFGKLWWSSGGYLRLDEPTRAVQPGETFGHVWFRTIVGIEL